MNFENKVGQFSAQEQGKTVKNSYIFIKKLEQGHRVKMCDTMIIMTM